MFKSNIQEPMDLNLKISKSEERLSSSCVVPQSLFIIHQSVDQAWILLSPGADTDRLKVVISQSQIV